MPNGVGTADHATYRLLSKAFDSQLVPSPSQGRSDSNERPSLQRAGQLQFEAREHLSTQGGSARRHRAASVPTALATGPDAGGCQVRGRGVRGWWCFLQKARQRGAPGCAGLFARLNDDPAECVCASGRWLYWLSASMFMFLAPLLPQGCLRGLLPHPRAVRTAAVLCCLWAGFPAHGHLLRVCATAGGPAECCTQRLR